MIVLYHDPCTNQNCWVSVADDAEVEKTLSEIVANHRCDPNGIRIITYTEEVSRKYDLKIPVLMTPELLDFIRYVKSMTDACKMKTALTLTLKQRHGLVTSLEPSSWYWMALNEFMNIDKFTFEALGIEKSKKVFDKILGFSVTQDMLDAEEDELGRFASPFLKKVTVG